MSGFFAKQKAARSEEWISSPAHGIRPVFLVPANTPPLPLSKRQPLPTQEARRRRAASIAGYARAAQPSAAEARQRGAETRGRQLIGDSSWGRRMAEAKHLKRYGPSPTLGPRVTALEQRLAELERGQVSTNGHDTEVAIPAATA